MDDDAMVEKFQTLFPFKRNFIAHYTHNFRISMQFFSLFGDKNLPKSIKAAESQTKLDYRRCSVAAIDI